MAMAKYIIKALAKQHRADVVARCLACAHIVALGVRSAHPCAYRAARASTRIALATIARIGGNQENQSAWRK
jgi:hypothetical protein